MAVVRGIVRERGQFFAFVLVVVLAVGAFEVLQRQHENDLRNEQQAVARQLKEAAIASCERGNSLRVIVFDNTLVIRDRLGPEIVAEQLKALRAQPYVDPQTGAVDCRAAVENPRPEES